MLSLHRFYVCRLRLSRLGKTSTSANIYHVRLKHQLQQIRMSSGLNNVCACATSHFGANVILDPRPFLGLRASSLPQSCAEEKRSGVEIARSVIRQVRFEVSMTMTVDSLVKGYYLHSTLTVPVFSSQTIIGILASWLLVFWARNVG